MEERNWKDQIPACFGSADAIFANHPSDAYRAIDLLKSCYKDCVQIDELLHEVSEHLWSKHGKNIKKEEGFKKHVQEQLCIIINLHGILKMKFYKNALILKNNGA